MTPEQIANIEAQLNASPEAAFLRARDEALKERDEARRKLDDLAERYKDLDAERERLRLELSAVSTPTAGVWFWQGAGDRPESLSCPVVMSAEKLRELLAHYCPKSNSVVTDRRGVESSCGACGAKSGPPPRGDS